ncbi:M14 metallopeptidase family protein [Bremerella sp. JC770]|uniref:M14 family metallopeptidase n=1 Tax=Bremerella sp. JC770 TaxID=3232137 RepID=UPI00345AE22F
MLRTAVALSVLMITSIVGGEEPQSQTPALPPEAVLGRAVGADYCLVQWKSVQQFYRQLADNTPTVTMSHVGLTTEGREFSEIVISSPENLSRLRSIKQASQTIADPRNKSAEEIEEAIENGKVILVITPTMHSNEPAATEMAMQLAWTLATSQEDPWRSMRETAVTVIVPSLNPDGMDRVAKWYAKNLGKPYEDAALPELYQKYVGHDNNRDFFALTQAESQLLAKLMYKQWAPQILWDVHQHGQTGARFFVPPYCDPLNENLDPLMVTGINAIGSRAVMDMTADGCTGIATGVSYDNWWNGGNRSVPARLNIIGILTEAASVNYASPVYLEPSDLRDPLGRGDYRVSNRFVHPWPGGWWRQADIIRYELAFARSLFGTISREPKLWLRQKLAAAKRASTLDDQSPRIAWLLTIDNEDVGALERLVGIMHQMGIEIHQSKTVLSADSRQYAPGTLVIRCDQPHSRLVDDLFELKKFPEYEDSYDVCGWSLPILFGLRAVEVVHDIEGDLTLVKPSDYGELFAQQDIHGLSDSRQWNVLNRLLLEQDALKVSKEGEGLREEKTPAVLKAAVQKVGQMPRVGIYAPWQASIDEGWLRWTLDYLEMPYQRIRNSMIKAGRLHDDFDVILIPDVRTSIIENGRRKNTAAASMTGGLDVDGMVAIEEFVEDGGKLIVMESACPWAIDLFRIPLIDTTAEKKNEAFRCSGSVVRGVMGEHELTKDLPKSMAFMFTHSKAWRVPTTKELETRTDADCQVDAMMKYAPRAVMLSGAMSQPEAIQDQIAWAKVEHQQGTIHLFGFRPYFRGWTHASFHLLMRAILFD